MVAPNILTQQEITDGLESLPGWVYKDLPAPAGAKAGGQAGNKISKEFKFEDFMGSLNFINKLAPFCEQLDHHPDVHIFYSKVLFELQRFDVGGRVTDKDFMVAHKIEELYLK